MAKIIAVADNTARQSAVRQGAALSKAFGDSLQVVDFTFTKRLESNLILSKTEINDVKRGLIQKAEDALSARLSKLPDMPKYQQKIIWEKNPTLWLLDQCAHHDIDMIIKSLPANGSALDNTADVQLMRDCPAPVWFSTSAGKRKHHKNVLACVDLATTITSKKRLNNRIMRTAKKVAEAMGCQLQVVFCIETPAMLQDLGILDARAYERKIRAEAAKDLAKFCSRHELDADQLHIRAGQADKVVLGAAEKYKADAVVIGTMGRSGMRGKLLGNTAEKVIRKIHGDVITLRPS